MSGSSESTDPQAVGPGTSASRPSPPPGPAAAPEPDLLLAELLALPRVRVALLLPVVAGVGYALMGGEVVNRPLVVGLSIVLLILATVPAVRPWGGSGRWIDAESRRIEEAWQLLSIGVGVGAMPLYLVPGLVVREELFAGIIALVLVIGAFAFPARRRLVMLAWVIAMWLITLWWAGRYAPAVLLVHLGGAVLVAFVALRSASALGQGLARESAARESAEHRAALLASLARTNSFDPDAVLRSVVDGLLAAGFDLAAIREIDEDAGVARLVEGASRFTATLAEEFPLAGSMHADVVVGERTLLRRSVGRFSTAVTEEPVRDVILVPLDMGGRVAAVVTAATSHRPISGDHRAAAELLSQQAGAALARAEAFRRDERTMEALRRLDDRTQDFVATVSHELRTPLTVVHGLGQTLLAHWDELEPERRRDLLDRIDANAARLSSMVSALLDVSAFEAGGMRPSLAPVLLRPALAAARHRMTSSLAGHPVRLEVDVDLRVRADTDLLDHIVENLLGNAVKHTPTGTPIEVSARRAAGRVVVSVRDHGPGIDPADLPHVMDRFYRGGEPSRRPTAGLGLGLALVRSLVEAHGGQLQVESAPGEGTVFSFDLPEDVDLPERPAAGTPAR